MGMMEIIKTVNKETDCGVFENKLKIEKELKNLLNNFGYACNVEIIKDGIKLVFESEEDNLEYNNENNINVCKRSEGISSIIKLNFYNWTCDDKEFVMIFSDNPIDENCKGRIIKRRRVEW